MRGWADLVGFALVLLLSLRAGVPAFDAGPRRWPRPDERAPDARRPPHEPHPDAVERRTGGVTVDADGRPHVDLTA